MRRMNKKGFTLVELLVVLAILGLLAVVGIPQYMKTLERSKEAADAAALAQVQSAFDVFCYETTYSLPTTGTVELTTEIYGTKNILTGSTTVDELKFGTYWEGEIPVGKSKKNENQVPHIGTNGKLSWGVKSDASSGD